MAAILTSLSHFSPSLLLLLCFIHFSILSSTEAQSGGFTADLIHRDSPLSPFYNPSSTNSDRLTGAFRRSLSRSAHFKPTSNSPNFIQSQIIPTDVDYLMKLSIGKPAFEILAVADTGSDLIWTQCKPCKDCFYQSSALFDPESSSTYRNLPCKSPPCETLGSDYACGSSSNGCDNNTCKYCTSYDDNSTSDGNLAVETFTFGSTSIRSVSIPNMVFGCGHENDGTFGNDEASGVIGLGGGQLSLVGQLHGSINGKFSYCLVSSETQSNATSKINFGTNAVVSGSGVVSTPLVTKEDATFYYVTLKGITVGNRTQKPITELASAPVAEEEGNIIIDSGTFLTFLPLGFYKNLESELKQSIKGKPVEQPPKSLGLCYKAEDDIVVPNITMHFSGGDLELPPSNTFFKYGFLVCLAMSPEEDDLAIFGNLSQNNFLIGYDIVEKVVSFMPTDCTTKH